MVPHRIDLAPTPTQSEPHSENMEKCVKDLLEFKKEIRSPKDSTIPHCLSINSKLFYVFHCLLHLPLDSMPCLLLAEGGDSAMYFYVFLDGHTCWMQ